MNEKTIVLGFLEDVTTEQGELDLTNPSEIIDQKIIRIEQGENPETGVSFFLFVLENEVTLKVYPVDILVASERLRLFGGRSWLDVLSDKNGDEK